MKFKRSSGILLHPTSLPSEYGIGDLGSNAYRFIDFLHQTKQSLWQIMPLGPTGFSDSPYAAFSAFAGNHYLISPELLEKEGLLDLSSIELPKFDKDRVLFEDVINFKMELFKKAFKNFEAINDDRKHELEHFSHHNSWWLDDYSLFMALKEHYKNSIWNTWDREIVERTKEAISYYSRELQDSINFHKFLQYQFFKQWIKLKEYANYRGIKIIGDIPIFVAYDSADVWANQELFYLDQNRNSTVVAGVPPDCFSETGQRWGNPLYRWDIMKEKNYEWWTNRFKISLSLVDIIRIDHFRGFEAYWEVPASESTAVNGRWVKGPNHDLFYKVQEVLGEVPIIAEDLGVITPEVEKLRDDFNYPGMKILQFAFSGPDNPYLPHNFTTPNCVVYTGTHDNDTTIGWFETLDSNEKEYVLKYLNTDGQNINWDLIRAGMASIANIAIFPLQDILGLGKEARMNTPGKESGNWAWRFTFDMINDNIKSKLKELTLIYGRVKKEETNE